MAELFLIIISAALINNVVLVKFLGLCPFMGVSNRLESAIGMGLATTFVLTLSSVMGYLIHNYILQPLEIEYLRTISFILVIAASVQLTEMFIRATSPLLHQVLGLFLPLITTNCAVLGVALLSRQANHNLLESAIFGFASALGFTLTMILFAAARERLNLADIPNSFKGAPIALITAGLMALALMGLTGLAKL